jgi:cytochrome b6-f complex iron-sulfur subunit
VDITLGLSIWALAGLLLVLARVLARPPVALVPVRRALPPGLYASTTAPTSAGPAGAARGGGGAATAAPPIDAVSRRKLLRWVGWTGILLVLGQLLVSFLPFFWPRKVGAFGGRVLAGNVSDYEVGDVKKITEGKFFISRVPEGFLALWQRCPHLGCSVPWDANGPSLDSIKPQGRFNCPCHGSQYDRYGQIIQGPAPRPMDLFPITIENGRIYVQTGPQVARQRAVADHQKDPTPA